MATKTASGFNLRFIDFDIERFTQGTYPRITAAREDLPYGSGYHPADRQHGEVELQPLVDTRFPASTPSKKSPDFIRKSGFFITPWAGNFYYYKVTVAEGGNGLLRMVANVPPVLREGFYCEARVVYFVPLQDLRRGVIRKSRRVILSNRALTYLDFVNATNSSADTCSPVAPTSSADAAPASLTLGVAPAIADPSILAGVRTAPAPGHVSFGDSAQLTEELGRASLAYQEQVSSLLNSEGEEEEWEAEDHS